ncbi:hypothetical protein [Stenotrophomonas rhizophila]|uniref:hypothetical protein n=1 Tax=Stenotrophomonas rhizophila TaxID=216778 RepID=UPI0021B2CAE0|nr:hypothetical protein [Stenotrophomonas rhizophila]
MSAWGSFHSWPVGPLALGPLRGGANKLTGRHIAAIKVFIAVAIEVDFTTRSSEITNDRLAHLTGLSRPMLLPAVEILEDRGVLKFDNSGYRNRFTQAPSAEDKRWTKVPVDLATKAMQQLPNRGVTVLAALKIYLKLLESRSNGNSKTLISHRKLVEAMSLPSRDVAAGIDHLVVNRLVHVRQHPALNSAGHPVNEYNLLGPFNGYGGSTN